MARNISQKPDTTPRSPWFTDSLLYVPLTMPKWSVRLELHQHPSGYEPDALLLSYRPEIKMVGYPGAAPGFSCSQNKRVLLALSYPQSNKDFK